MGRSSIKYLKPPSCIVTMCSDLADSILLFSKESLTASLTGLVFWMDLTGLLVFLSGFGANLKSISFLKSSCIFFVRKFFSSGNCSKRSYRFISFTNSLMSSCLSLVELQSSVMISSMSSRKVKGLFLSGLVCVWASQMFITFSIVSHFCRVIHLLRKYDSVEPISLESPIVFATFSISL
uniref:Uncharacterized protein n=1 Tax=Cacopsylla melanoneura TaxID=428564 RepID=A0A8D8R500_9HEMI